MSPSASEADYFLPALNFAQRVLCAAAIFARAFADIFLRLRPGLPVPRYTPAKAASAAFNPDNCLSTESRSFFNCFIIPDRFANVFPLGCGLYQSQELISPS